MSDGSPLRVLIDARLLGTRGGGIARYVAELSNAIAPAAPDLNIRLLVRSAGPDQFDRGQLSTIQTLTPPHHRLERWSLGLEAALRRPRLIHSPDFIQPLVPGARSVVTIHDLAFLDPEGEGSLTAESLRYYRQVLRSARRADAIIAVSDYVKQTIVERLSIPERRIRTIYNGVTRLQPADLAPVPHDDASPDDSPQLPKEIQPAIDTHRPVILMVGTIEPRKRHDLLLDALEISWSRPTNERLYLLVIGREGWRCEATAKRLRELSTSGNGYWVDVADDRLLGWAFGHATLLAMPSRDEGFGLPILEAMANGLPVVAAARGALPEVAGGAAVLIQSDHPEEWSTTIESLITAESRREALKRAGLLRASAFSWERTALETAQLYREVLGQ